MKYTYMAVLFALAIAGCSKEPDSIIESIKADEVSEAENNEAEPARILTPQQQACRGAVTNIDFEKDTVRNWFDRLADKCKSLTDEEQKAALGGQINENGVVSTYGETINELAQDLRDGNLPFYPQDKSFAEGWLAMNNVYQAQRNYAFSLPHGAEKCAMRVVILSNAKADLTDQSNYEVDCKDQLSIDVEPLVRDIKAKIKKWSAPAKSEYPEPPKKDLVII